MLLAIEICLSAIAIALAYVVPTLGAEWFGRCERALGKFACGWLGQRWGVVAVTLCTEGATALLIAATVILPLAPLLALLKSLEARGGRRRDLRQGGLLPQEVPEPGIGVSKS